MQEEQATAPLQTNPVLVYLSNQERKRLKEEEQKERAAEAERKRTEKEQALGVQKDAGGRAGSGGGGAANGAKARVSKIGYKPGRTIGQLGLSVEAKGGTDSGGGGGAAAGDLDSYLESKGLVTKQSKPRLTPEEKQRIARQAALLGHRAERVAFKPPETDDDMSTYYQKASRVAGETRQYLAEADDSLDWPEMLIGTEASSSTEGGLGRVESGAATQSAAASSGACADASQSISGSACIEASQSASDNGPDALLGTDEKSEKTPELPPPPSSPPSPGGGMTPADEALSA